MMLKRFQRREPKDTKRPSLGEKLGEVFCNRAKQTCYYKASLQLTINMGNLTKEEMKMTRGSQIKGLERGFHNKMIHDAKVVGKTKMGDEEVTKEIFELKEQLNIMMTLLKKKN